MKIKLLISLVAVAFVSVLYFLYLNLQKPAVTVSTPTPTIILTQVADPTAGWKTYENKQYGFSFKYPNTIKLESWSVQQTKLALSQVDKQPGLMVVSTRDVTINQKPFHITININEISEETSLFFSNNNMNFIVGLGHISENQTNQILSTFKFTEEKTSKLSWITINYPRYNLTFKMPKDWYFSNDSMNLSTQQITKDETIDSFGNILFILDNPKSKYMLTISLDPEKPKYFNIDKTENLIEFDQIISSIKFTQ